MSRRIVWAGAIGFFGGLLVAGALWWLNDKKRLERIEQRLTALENRVDAVENKILEFQSAYYEDKAEIEYSYAILKREIEQLQVSSLSEERKKELDEWLDFLEQLKEQKIQEKQRKRKETPAVYI